MARAPDADDRWRDNDKICDRCCRSSAFEIPGKIMTVELVMLGELWLLQVMKMYLVDEPLRLEWIGFNVRGERSCRVVENAICVCGWWVVMAETSFRITKTRFLMIKRSREFQQFPPQLCKI